MAWRSSQPGICPPRCSLPPCCRFFLLFLFLRRPQSLQRLWNRVTDRLGSMYRRNFGGNRDQLFLLLYDNGGNKGFVGGKIREFALFRGCSSFSRIDHALHGLLRRWSFQQCITRITRDVSMSRFDNGGR